MALIDWAIIALYVSFTLFVGVYFSKRAAKSETEFFVAGRSLPWYVAGTSMVATTFSSDTPLFVAAASRDDGIIANWIWWASLIGGLATVFFFAKLWRRSKAITEIEFVSLRYGKSTAVSLLRVFRALYDGVFYNGIIMASVTLAMSKILVLILDLPEQALFVLPMFGDITPATAILVLLGLIAVLYTALSGLYGVVYTDLVQFLLAMIGSFSLAGIVYADASSGNGLMANLQSAEGFSMDKLSFFPSSFGMDMITFTFIVLIMFSWLSTAPGSGYFIQRTLATRSEKDAALSIYWFSFCHYVLRSWPWIFIGLASLIYFPDLVDSEKAYPAMIERFLPVGLKGIMVASLLAAFMSTLDTHLNWGTSYLINDVYRPFMVKNKPEKHYVLISRICMFLLALCALFLATKLSGILAAYKYLIVVMSGISFVLIARWYWWRINVWSEVSSLVCALLLGNLLYVVFPDSDGTDYFALRLFVNLLVTTTVCIAVTFATSSGTPVAHVVEFYRKLRVPGPGWKKVRNMYNLRSDEGDDFAASIIGWVASVFFIYALLFAGGYALFQQWPAMIAALCIAVLSGFVSFAKLRVVIAKSKVNITHE